MQEPQQEGGSVSISECRQRGKVTRAQRVLALLALAAAEKLLPEDIPPRPALIYTRSGSELSDGPTETQWKLWGAERGPTAPVPEDPCASSFSFYLHPKHQLCPLACPPPGHLRTFPASPAPTPPARQREQGAHVKSSNGKKIQRCSLQHPRGRPLRGSA